jgi:hypothetical protein
MPRSWEGLPLDFLSTGDAYTGVVGPQHPGTSNPYPVDEGGAATCRAQLERDRTSVRYRPRTGPPYWPSRRANTGRVVAPATSEFTSA